MRGTRAETMRAGYLSRPPANASAWVDGSGAQHGLAQRVEADPADVQGAAVKGIALPGLDLLSQLEPETLADLVGGRLPWPAEIAVELEAQEVLGHVGVSSQELPGLVIGPRATAYLGGSLETTVDPDVQNHTRRAKRLTVKHAHTVARVLHVP